MLTEYIKALSYTLHYISHATLLNQKSWGGGDWFLGGLLTMSAGGTRPTSTHPLPILTIDGGWVTGVCTNQVCWEHYTLSNPTFPRLKVILPVQNC